MQREQQYLFFPAETGGGETVKVNWDRSSFFRVIPYEICIFGLHRCHMPMSTANMPKMHNTFRAIYYVEEWNIGWSVCMRHDVLAVCMFVNWDTVHGRIFTTKPRIFYKQQKTQKRATRKCASVPRATLESIDQQLLPVAGCMACVCFTIYSFSHSCAMLNCAIRLTQTMPSIRFRICLPIIAVELKRNEAIEEKEKTNHFNGIGTFFIASLRRSQTQRW